MYNYNRGYANTVEDRLKEIGYYPYPFIKKTLKRKGPKIAAILDFLLPVETCFWVVHFAYAFVNKRIFK